MKWLLLTLAMCAPALAQIGPNEAPRIDLSAAPHWYDRLIAPYMPQRVAPVRFENSPRIDSLLRAGSLYLSLSDAIALVLENNLDIEVERFEPPIASTDIQRAKGGGFLRGISLFVNDLPPGIGGPATPLLTAAATSLPTSTVATSLFELAAITPPAPVGIAITGASIFSQGPPVPQFDPVLTASASYQRQNVPQASTFVTGTSTLTGYNINGALGFTQGFSPGTMVSTDFTSTQQSSNSTRNILNPYNTSTLNVTVTQPLLRGFGVNMNRRFIRIAKNNLKTSDQVFRQQVIYTVSDLIALYNDLVALLEDVQVKEQTLALAQRLYQDTSIAVQQGTLAPVELTRAEAQVAAAEQDLANSRGFALQQELLVKTVITKRGTADPGIRNARVVPTTMIKVPEKEPVEPLDDLMAAAFQNRPELEAARLQIQNSHISLEGARNELLPQLDLVATGQNMGLAGSINPLANTGTGTGTGTGSGTELLPGSEGVSVGGIWTGLGQIFTGRFPTYSIGVQLTLPLRNRIAQADYTRDEMQLRQWQVRYQQLQNQVRLEVEGALIALQRSRAAYDAAARARILQEQSLMIEMERYTNGLSTTFLVMQYQSQVAQARSTEVAARDTYAKARAALERATGLILENHNISIDEAYHGQVMRAPSAIP